MKPQYESGTQRVADALNASGQTLPDTELIFWPSSRTIMHVWIVGHGWSPVGVVDLHRRHCVVDFRRRSNSAWRLSP